MNKAEQRLLQQASSANELKRKKKTVLVGVIIWIIGAAAIVANDPSFMNICFGIALAGGALMALGYSKFRADALGLIQKLCEDRIATPAMNSSGVS